MTVDDIIYRRSLDVFLLSEAEWKGKRKIICGSVEDLRSGVNENEHAKVGETKQLSE